ncbi:hypothetical protein [Pedobacter immunditicola]|uniref:hypothetical protein n=1 Tax=Pedobacter immunditicola TaxID=3133440 RepID=UPI00309A634A
MEKKRLAYLLKKYNSGKCNTQEIKELEDWYNKIDYLTGAERDEQPGGFEEEMLEDFHYKRLRQRMKSISDRHKKRVSTKFAIAIGIAIVVVVIVVIWVMC